MLKLSYLILVTIMLWEFDFEFADFEGVMKTKTRLRACLSRILSPDRENEVHINV